jgi:hypothetical protein
MDQWGRVQRGPEPAHDHPGTDDVDLRTGGATAAKIGDVEPEQPPPVDDSQHDPVGEPLTDRDGDLHEPDGNHLDDPDVILYVDAAVDEYHDHGYDHHGRQRHDHLAADVDRDARRPSDRRRRMTRDSRMPHPTWDR